MFFPQGLGPPWFPRWLLESCFHHGLLFQFFLSEDIALELLPMFLLGQENHSHAHTCCGSFPLLTTRSPNISYNNIFNTTSMMGYKGIQTCRDRERERQKKKRTFLILHTKHYHQIIVPSDAPGAPRISIPGWANDPMQCANVKLVKTFRFLPDKGFTK